MRKSYTDKPLNCGFFVPVIYCCIIVIIQNNKRLTQMAYDSPRPSTQEVGSTDLAVAKDDLITLDIAVNSTDETFTNRKGIEKQTLTFSTTTATEKAAIATVQATIATAQAVIAQTYAEAIGSYTNTVTGLVWDSTNDTYLRTGSSNFTLIQEQMKRCVLNADGSVNYFLNPNNSNFKEDGVTPSVLDGTDGNVMVQIPKFYVKYTVAADIKKVEISQTIQTGFTVHPAFIKDSVEVDYRYYRAYECHEFAAVLLSSSGFMPKVSKTIADFRAFAVANGTGWHLTDWRILDAVKLLYLIEFGTFNSQSVLGDGNSSIGSYGVTTGQSNSLGNKSSTDSTVGEWMSYRGIENFYGDIYEFIDGINTRDRLVYLNDDYNTFASNIFTGDYVSTGVSVPTASASYINDLNFGSEGFIFTSAVGGSSSTYITDAAYSGLNDVVYQHGGTASEGLICGVFCSRVKEFSTVSVVNCGASISF